MEVLNLLPAADYDFLVKNAEDTVSQKTGKPMIKLTLAIWDNHNKERTVYDYLMPSMMYKVKHFADSIGIEDLYAAGGYEANDCINKSGRCKIVVDMKEDSQFPPSNVVKDYIKRSEGQKNNASAPSAPEAGHPAFSDDIPF